VRANIFSRCSTTELRNLSMVRIVARRSTPVHSCVVRVNSCAALCGDPTERAKGVTRAVSALDVNLDGLRVNVLGISLMTRCW
jgi:hypothetical protein